MKIKPHFYYWPRRPIPNNDYCPNAVLGIRFIPPCAWTADAFDNELENCRWFRSFSIEIGLFFVGIYITVEWPTTCET